KKSWFKRHLWLIVLTVLVIIGVIFALGPVQLFRIIRLVGALRILRTGRIIKAGRLLSGRISGRWNRLAALGVSILVAIFVAATLADPSSTVREILRGVLPFDFGPIAVIASGLILAGATFIVLFDRNSKDELDAEPGNDGGQS
ncbi:MAG: hypothetical protein L0G66_15555, partial [Brevibacterium sp.]|nr:hypothetical protein [Brevibacterium sp.]